MQLSRWISSWWCGSPGKHPLLCHTLLSGLSSFPSLLCSGPPSAFTAWQVIAERSTHKPTSFPDTWRRGPGRNCCLEQHTLQNAQHPASENSLRNGDLSAPSRKSVSPFLSHYFQWSNISFSFCVILFFLLIFYSFFFHALFLCFLILFF